MRKRWKRRHNQAADALRHSFVANRGAICRSTFRHVCSSYGAEPEFMQAVLEQVGLHVQQRQSRDSDLLVMPIYRESRTA